MYAQTPTLDAIRSYHSNGVFCHCCMWYQHYSGTMCKTIVDVPMKVKLKYEMKYLKIENLKNSFRIIPLAKFLYTNVV